MPAALGAAMPGGAETSLASKPLSDAEKSLLMQLRARSRALDRREAAVAVREQLLKAAEARLSARLDQLAALQQQLTAQDALRKARDEANWTDLVKVYGTMRPQDAALIFDDLQMDVLLPVMDRMPDRKAAGILAAMDPNKARALTTQLAQYRLNRLTGQQNDAAPGH